MKEFFVKSKNALIVLGICLLTILISMIFADQIQKSWGKVEVKTEMLEIKDEVTGNEIHLGYKIYIPKTASKENKAPAALLLHGYQNDHETCDAYCIELSRRGFVVLAIDEYGHGSTTEGFANRGYVNHKVTVNYGNDDEGVTFKTTGGQKRYRAMMNFSNLSFFDEKYTKDDAGQTLTDSSMGGITAYYWLSELEYVDNTKMVISGHSMGTWASWSVAAFYGNDPIRYPKAVVLQCGELFRMNTIPDADGHKAPYDTTKIHFGNVLLIQAKYDEFSYFTPSTKRSTLIVTGIR